MLCRLPKLSDENLLVGFDTSDDAAVYRVSPDNAVILTMDFFTPVVDDPYTFGQVAAANSLSDVYAMGGRPVTAMNIVCFPTCLPLDILKEILRGGYDKVAEAGAVLVGGHSIEDDEPKYGLSVMGMVHPDRIITNAGARAGDLLVLTKPLGTGILNTAIKADILDCQGYTKAVDTMAYLNRDACNAMLEVGVSACTDITGFGLLGHACEMARGSGVCLEIWQDKLPIIEESVDLARMGIIPGGAYKNRAYLDGQVRLKADIKQEIVDIMYDPQTSGGLLISVPEDRVVRLEELLKATNRTPFGIVGRVKEKSGHAVDVL